MDGPAIPSDDQLEHPPLRIFERLRQIPGYIWDETQAPFHTSYENWHVFGTRFVSLYSTPTAAAAAISPSAQHQLSASPSSISKLASARKPSPGDFISLPLSTPQSDTGSERSAASPPAALALSDDTSVVEEHIVAKISHYVLREERAFHVAKSLVSWADKDAEHIAKPIEFVRLPPVSGDRGSLIAAIYQYPGGNHIPRMIDLGPAFYWAHKIGDRWDAHRDGNSTLDSPIDLKHFLEFAIGASHCLEMIHRHGTIHGEIRGDAFHYNLNTHTVKLVSFGSGQRSFEHGLQHTKWSAISNQPGAKNKFLYISPEQTGRMPAEPDARTDIYSLGVVFWTLLTQRPAFEGDTPFEIIQSVLNRTIPSVLTYRMDIPEVVNQVIQKCTHRNVKDRYHSASGLRHDLVQVQQFLSAGDDAALKQFRTGVKDISSFFNLPTTVFGRDKQKADIIRVLDRVTKSHSIAQNGIRARFSVDGSIPSYDLFEGAEASSECGSSGNGEGGADRRSGSFTTAMNLSDPRSRSGFYAPIAHISESTTSARDTSSSGYSNSSTSGTLRLSRQYERAFDSKSLGDGGGTDTPHASSGLDSSSSLSRQLGSARQKRRRRGHCEVVVVEGVGGLGKTSLMQSVVQDARKRGYCATAKFDTASRRAFGPLLTLLSSLFKQVWGERNTETPFHQALELQVRPVWPMLSQLLGLPDFLLGSAETKLVRSPSNPLSLSQANNHHRHHRNGIKRRGSSPETSPGSSILRKHRTSTKKSHDFLRAGTSSQSVQLMKIFLDVLRMFTDHKFICFCLDDLHFADDESLELISQIVGARFKMALIVTYRPEEFTGGKLEQLERVLSPPDLDKTPGNGGLSVTKIVLTPLSEEDIVKYVGITLGRPPEDIYPLALVLESKTAGNPFYMREMLNACYRKKCIEFDYSTGQWTFDLDKLYHHFQGEKFYDVLDTAFITRRLNELPSASRSILAWAALLGQTFSFDMVCKLMSGEFHDDELCSETNGRGEHHRKAYSQKDAVAGLHAAIQAYIIVPSDLDDRYRFAHDRYIQAAAALEECNPRKMHYVIAQTLLQYYSSEIKWKERTAAHICEAADIIRRRISHRRRFRNLLSDCAQVATENGARATAAKYYSNAVALLQPNPWKDGTEDVSYAETMQLYLRAAECYLYMGRLSAASDVLHTIFTSTETAADRAEAWLLESRIHAQGGNSVRALACLKDCLKSLDVDYDENPTFAKCDDEFRRLATKMQAVDRHDLISPPGSDSNGLASLGAILAETISAAWWSDCLQFYHLSLVMMNLHLTRGAFPQSGMPFLHMSMISLTRFNMIDFTIDIARISLELIEKYRDPFCMARGYMIYANWISHVQYPVTVAVTQLEGAVDFASSAGDRISAILSFGLAAQLKFFASENCADLEAFCLYGCEEIPDWHKDTRGGTILIAVRQTCRALAGKTWASDPLHIFSDDQHNNVNYKQWLQETTNNGGRSLLFYETMEMVPLFLYGHYEHAVEIGKACYKNCDILWSARNTRLAMLFYGLTLAGIVLRQQQSPRLLGEALPGQVEETIRQVEELNDKIKSWQTYTDINYRAWSLLLDAQIAEMLGRDGDALTSYEAALDHAEAHNFVFEGALGHYLMANIFIRRSASRSARSALQGALYLFRQVGAVGIAERIEEEHSLLIHGLARSPRSVDAAVQTDFAGDTTSAQYRNVGGEDGEDPPQALGSDNVDTKGDRIGAWQGSTMQPEAGVGLPALDMIDLSAILTSSQIISSVLRVDELLKTMCNVILQTCGGSAMLAAIVVQDEGTSEWCVAASGDPERGAEAHIPGIPLSGTHLVAENVVLYCTRFREVVFSRDLVQDERIGNVSDQWVQRNPHSKAVIAIPISRVDKQQLLGAVYLEGAAGSFTDRNVEVLQLLVNQLSISYSNALAMKAVEKVSAENVSMVAMQKDALEKAREAEAKAKAAEAEARRNVELAEEAAKAKSIFLANVSHELRTPLNGVIGNSDLLSASENLSKEELEWADSIRVSADLLLTVINDILDFSRMEADKMKLYVIAFNPEEMVREVVRAVSYSNREKTSKKNVKIIQDINLPPMLIYGDPIRLHQVLGNLIGNSLKFTGDGSITIGARVDSETDERATLTFWVKDTGIGISQEQMQKLFVPFSQADASTARRYGGSGLGLSICKSLIETMMKGKIELESEAQQGTTAWFTVTFDKAPSEVVAGDAQAARKALPEQRTRSLSDSEGQGPAPTTYGDLAHIPRDQLRICIAEDNEINAKIAMTFIKRLGYARIDSYDNGEKAVEGVRRKAMEGSPYHVILMDVQMPVLDGYEATKLLRTDPMESVRKILVIAMTASAIQGDREKCLAAGMNDYLAKPVKQDVLKKKLETYLGVQVSPGPGSSTGGNKTPSSTRALNNPQHSPSSPSHSRSASLASPVSRQSEPNGTSTMPLSPLSPLSPQKNDPSLLDGQQGLARTSSETAKSIKSMAGEVVATGGESPLIKRQPRKLTKTRKDSDVTVVEKARNGVLKTSTDTVKGGENTPPVL